MARTVYDSMKKRNYKCANEHTLTEIRWGRDSLPICPECSQEMQEFYPLVRQRSVIEFYPLPEGIVTKRISSMISVGANSSGFAIIDIEDKNIFVPRGAPYFSSFDAKLEKTIELNRYTFYFNLDKTDPVMLKFSNGDLNILENLLSGKEKLRYILRPYIVSGPQYYKYVRYVIVVGSDDNTTIDQYHVLNPSVEWVK